MLFDDSTLNAGVFGLGGPELIVLVIIIAGVVYGIKAFIKYRNSGSEPGSGDKF